MCFAQRNPTIAMHSLCWCVLAFTFLVVVATLTLILPYARLRQRRESASTRKSLTLESWVAAYYPEYGDRIEVIRVVLKTYSEVYGIAIEKVRPDDALYENYGYLNQLVLDDSAPTFLGGVEARLRRESSIGWRPGETLRTVDDVIRSILR